jgi:hypothetical protein
MMVFVKVRYLSIFIIQKFIAKKTETTLPAPSVLSKNDIFMKTETVKRDSVDAGLDSDTPVKKVKVACGKLFCQVSIYIVRNMWC